MLGPLLEVERSKKCTPLWREARLGVKMYKTHQPRTTFGSWDVEKEWKSERRCGAKHGWKSKCTKHTSPGPLLEVEMLNKCTPLLREAQLEVKLYKAHHSRTTFGSWDVEKVQAIVARSTCGSHHVQSTPFSDHFWKLSLERSNKCTSLWGAAHLAVKRVKNCGF